MEQGLGIDSVGIQYWHSIILTDQSVLVLIKLNRDVNLVRILQLPLDILPCFLIKAYVG